MISKNSVVLVEPIVLAVDRNLLPNSSDIIKGLLELSHDAVPYTEQYRKEIEETTAGNGHSELADQVSTILAEKMRDIFSQIQRYGVGVAKAIHREFDYMSCRENVIDVATNALGVNFINLDHPFLMSTIYPTEVKDKQFAYTNIDLSVRRKLTFNSDLINELRESYINSQHPDIVALMNDPDGDPWSAFNAVFDHEGLNALFNHNGDLFNFSEVRSFDLVRIFQLYVVVSKMYASEDPIKALTSGELSDYRQYMHLLWNGLTTYLLRIKTMVNVYRGRGIAIQEIKPVHFKQETRKFEITNSHFTYESLSGQVNVFYTQSSVNMLTQANYCLRDWVIGRLVANLTGQGGVPDSALLSGNLLGGILEKLYSRLQDGFWKNRRETGEMLFQRAISAFINSDADLSAWVKEMAGSGTGGEKIIAIMNAEYKTGYNLVAFMDSNPELSTLDAVMASDVVPRFMKAIGCTLAGRVLSLSSSQHGDDVQEKRKRLHYAVTRVLVESLI